MKRFVSNIKILLIRIILSFKDYKSEASIIIFSETRGGSTWLMELLANIDKTVINWEPLHPDEGVVPKEYNWGWRPYLPEENNIPEYTDLLTKILAFKQYNRWTNQYLSIKSLMRGRIVITKFVRANMLAPYLLKNIPLNKKPILLLRHPIDVCMSQIKTFKESNNPKTYIAPNCINNKRYIQHAEFIGNLETPLEFNVALWCINNVPTLTNSNFLSKVIMIYYEDLLLHPEDEYWRIIEQLGIEKSKVNKNFSFRKMSSTALNKAENKQNLNKSLEKLTETEKIRIQGIFDYFNFKIYNAFNKDIVKGVEL